MDVNTEIVLSDEDWEMFMEAYNNLPEPSEYLKNAFKEHKKLMQNENLPFK